MKKKDEYKKYFILNPVNQITISPLIAISTAVPRSGCDTTKKTGIIKLKKGIKICFMLLTFCTKYNFPPFLNIRISNYKSIIK